MTSAAGPDPRWVRLVGDLAALGRTVACAESLTAGLVTATIADVPGASAVLRGGVVAYATEVKAAVLGVDPVLLDERGAVDADVALAMAAGVCRLVGADLGVATTGVAGPDPQDGRPVGRVHVAVVWPGRSDRRAEVLDLPGDRAAVRRGAADAALALLATVVAEELRALPPTVDT